MAKKLKAFVDKLEDVEQKWQELYVEEKVGDKTRYRLDAEGVEDVTGLRNTVTALRTENNGLKKKTEPLKEIGEEEDVDEIIAAGRASLEAKRTGKALPEVEQATQALTKKHEKIVAGLKAESEGLMEALRESAIEGGAKVAIKDADGNEKLLLPHVKGMLDLVRIVEGDKIRYETRVFEGTGSSRTERTDSAGKPLGIDAAVAELRSNDDFADAFVSRITPGTGAAPEGGSGMPTPPRTRSTPREPAGATSTAAKDAKRQTQDYTL